MSELTDEEGAMNEHMVVPTAGTVVIAGGQRLTATLLDDRVEQARPGRNA